MGQGSLAFVSLLPYVHTYVWGKQFMFDCFAFE